MQFTPEVLNITISNDPKEFFQGILNLKDYTSNPHFDKYCETTVAKIARGIAEGKFNTEDEKSQKDLNEFKSQIIEIVRKLAAGSGYGFEESGEVWRFVDKKAAQSAPTPATNPEAPSEVPQAFMNEEQMGKLLDLIFLKLQARQLI
jgi:hypothetical protein